MTDMASPRAQSMGEIEGRRRRVLDEYPEAPMGQRVEDIPQVSESRFSRDDRDTPSIDSLFEHIDRCLDSLREDILVLEDKLGPYLKSEPVPGEDDRGEKPSSMTGRSTFYETLERYPAMVSRLQSKVRILTHLIDR